MTRASRLALVAALLAFPALPAAAQQTQIRGFADVGFAAASRDVEQPAFGLGQFDLFVTSQLSRDLSFLGETVFEYDAGFLVDVERVIVTWAPRAAFRVSAGKHHTPLGYWNNAYHHGALLQPTAQRPLAVLFEDEGGVLPIHTTGLLVSGRDIGPLHLGYDALVGNGIGATPNADNDRQKSVTLAVHSQVTSTLQLGVSYYGDHVSAGTATLAGDSLGAPMRQQIAGAHLARFGPRLEVAGEYFHVMNAPDGAASMASDAGYAYAGWRVGAVVPYARYDRIRFDGADPWFGSPSTTMGTVGLRYDLSSAATVKGEVRRRDDAAIGPRTEVQAQVAIGF